MIALCFAKVMSGPMPDTLLTMGLPTPPSEVQKIGDQMQLLADLYVFLVDEVPQSIRKDFIDTMSFFAKDALENIHGQATSDPSLVQYMQAASTPTPAGRGQHRQGSPVPLKLHLIERVIYACVTIGTAITEGTVVGPPPKRIAVFDSEVLIWAGQLVVGIHTLVEHLDPVFQGDFASLESRHVLFGDRQFSSRLIKNLLDDHEVDRNGQPDYSCSLLHLSLQLAYNYSELLLRDDSEIMPQRAEQRSQLASYRTSFLKDMLNVVDLVVIKQM